MWHLLPDLTHEGGLAALCAGAGFDLLEPFEFELFAGFGRRDLFLHVVVCVDLCIGHPHVDEVGSQRLLLLHVTIAHLEGDLRLVAELVHEDVVDWGLGPQSPAIRVLLMRQSRRSGSLVITCPDFDIVVLKTFGSIRLKENMKRIRVKSLLSSREFFLGKLTMELVAPSASTTLFSFLKSLMSGFLAFSALGSSTRY